MQPRDNWNMGQLSQVNHGMSKAICSVFGFPQVFGTKKLTTICGYSWSMWIDFCPCLCQAEVVEIVAMCKVAGIVNSKKWKLWTGGAETKRDMLFGIIRIIFLYMHLQNAQNLCQTVMFQGRELRWMWCPCIASEQVILLFTFRIFHPVESELRKALHSCRKLFQQLCSSIARRVLRNSMHHGILRSIRLDWSMLERVCHKYICVWKYT